MKNKKITIRHKNVVWCNKDGLWQTYLPTEDGRRRKNNGFEGRRIFDKNKYRFNYRVNEFYKTGKILSQDDATERLYGYKRANKKDLVDVMCGDKKCCVYEYVDKQGGVPRYVGIVYKQSILERHIQHLYNEDWCNEKDFFIRYVEVNNRSEAEALEAHLIALHKTFEFYNTSKNDWGLNSFLLDYEIKWKIFDVKKAKKIAKDEIEKERNEKRFSSVRRMRRRKSYMDQIEL